MRFVRVIRLPACARVSRVSRVCPGSPRCLFTGNPTHGRFNPTHVRAPARCTRIKSPTTTPREGILCNHSVQKAVGYHSGCPLQGAAAEQEPGSVAFTTRKRAMAMAEQWPLSSQCNRRSSPFLTFGRTQQASYCRGACAISTLFGTKASKLPRDCFWHGPARITSRMALPSRHHLADRIRWGLSWPRG